MILHLSSWAVCSNFTKELFTCRLLSRAAPLAFLIVKAIVDALALFVFPNAFISTAPFIGVLAAV